MFNFSFYFSSLTVCPLQLPVDLHEDTFKFNDDILTQIVAKIQPFIPFVITTKDFLTYGSLLGCIFHIPHFIAFFFLFFYERLNNKNSHF